MLVYEYFKVRKLRIFDLNVGLWSANSALCVPYGRCSVSVHSTLMYRVECVLSLCTINISDVLSAECSVSLQGTHLWCTARKMLCFCAQYTFRMCRLESVLGLCTVHISDIPSGKCSVCVNSTHFWSNVLKVFSFCAQYEHAHLLLFFSIFVQLFIMNMFQQVKLLMQNSMLNSWSVCVNVCDVHDPNCGRRTRGSCSWTMHLHTPRSLRVSFWPKQNHYHGPPSLFVWFGTLWLLPVP
jgi:hypothetical protein